MSDMENFLGDSVVNSVKDAQRLNHQMDGFKLIGQRKINISLQEELINNKAYIRSLEETIKNLKNEIAQLENSNGPFFDPFTNRVVVPGQKEFERGLRQGYQECEQEYQNLLSKPFHEIARKNDNFRLAYEEQMELIADWMVTQKAFKELAIEFGFEAHGYTPEQVTEMGKDKKIDVLENKHDPSHKTNSNTNSDVDLFIQGQKDKLISRYNKYKEARKSIKK